MKKLKLSYDTRKQLLDKTQYLGLTVLGWILRGMTRILFGPETWRGFSALSTSQWVRESARYSLPYSTIKGIDQALKDNFSPEEAVDRLARKAGVSKKEIKASKLPSPVESLPTDEEIDAERKALETAISNSIPKSS